MAKRSAKPTDDEPLDDDKPEVAEVEDEVVDDVDDSPAGDEGDAGEEAVEEVVVPSWREKLGGEYAALDDEAAVARLQSERQQWQEAQRQAQQWQYLYAQNQQAAQLQAQQQAAAQAQQAQKPTKPAWEAPEFNRAWLQQLQKNPATGEVELKPGADPTILSKIQAHVSWKEENEHKFWSQPGEFLAPLIEPHINTLIDQRVQAIIGYRDQQEAERREQASVAEWERQYAKVLTTDGGTLTPDLSNLSPVGRVIVQTANELRQAGVADRRQALDKAYAIVAGNAAMAHYSQQPAPTQKQQQTAYLKKQVPRNRDGSFAKNGNGKQLVTAGKSFREQMNADWDELHGDTE